MRNENMKINYTSMIKRDSWKLILDSITRLITIEEDLGGENVEELEKLNKLAEKVKEKTTEKPSAKYEFGRPMA
ncbi:MAG: hypothetical protein FWD97_06455 [Defluviitaleaceae bacterium]|nr:hypothetical protein [Defluviitaleaceae bacterium]